MNANRGISQYHSSQDLRHERPGNRRSLVKLAPGFLARIIVCMRSNQRRQPVALRSVPRAVVALSFQSEYDERAGLESVYFKAIAFAWRIVATQSEKRAFSLFSSHPKGRCDARPTRPADLRNDPEASGRILCRTVWGQATSQGSLKSEVFLHGLGASPLFRAGC